MTGSDPELLLCAEAGVPAPPERAGSGWAAGGGGVFAFNSVHFCIIDVCVYVHVKLLMCVYFFLKTQLLHIN